MANLWRKSQQIEFDLEGDIARGALLYFFAANTTTSLTVWQDADLSVPHEHPLEASGAGRWPAIYLPFVSYRERAVTVGGTLLFDTPQIDNPAPIEPEEIEIEGYSTGDIKWRIEQPATEIDGWVRCNGRTIGPPGSGALERANDDCEQLFLHRWADSNATIGGGRGASAQGDWDAGNKTITLPDLRSAFIMGLDDMGNAASGRITGVPGIGNGAGIQYGNNLHALIEQELAAHQHPVAITSQGGTAHTHSLDAANGATAGTIFGGGHVHGSGTLSGVTGGGSAHFHTPNTLGGTTGAGTAHTHGLGTLGGSTSSDGAHTHDVKYDVTTAVVAAGATIMTAVHSGGGTTGAAAAISNGAHSHPTLTMTGTLTDESLHTHPFSVTTGQTSNESLHTHPFSVTAGQTGEGGAHSHTFTGNTAFESIHTHAVIGSTQNAGIGNPHNNVPYSIAGTYYQKL